MFVNPDIKSSDATLTHTHTHAQTHAHTHTPTHAQTHTNTKPKELVEGGRNNLDDGVIGWR